METKIEYDKDRNIENDLQGGEEIKIPPLPRPLRENLENIKYEGDMDNYNNRIFFKLMSLWFFWVEIVSSENISKLMETENDKESDIYKATNIIVDLVDHLGAILGMTRIEQECAWLKMSDSHLVTDSD